MNYRRNTALFLVALVAGVYLIAPVAANGGTSSGTISGTFKTGNTPPAVVQIYTPSTVNPTPDGQTSIDVGVVVRDTDGWADIAKVETSLHNAENSLIEIDYAQTTGDWSVLDANTISCWMTLHFRFWDPPTGYAVTVTATDSAGATGTATSGGIVYTSAIGLAIEGPSALDFGILTYGSVSSAQYSAIHNSANTPIVIRGYAPDWASSAGGSSVPARTLTANGVSMNDYDPIVQLPLGYTPYQIAFVERVPTTGLTLAGTYTTTITLTASSS
jgi:hypothetical protein